MLIRLRIDKCISIKKKKKNQSPQFIPLSFKVYFVQYYLKYQVREKFRYVLRLALRRRENMSLK